ncbi:hypothetical protein [Streptomyces sp. NBC_00342]|uniref:hypothetical protein n=1 Tax=Streptomyces sp. NBC_00342 TaxID=2975718 RepID=UPI002E2D81DA|nr:hypothetical protein [Streptomyces sp. NBC_00342]
MTQIGGDSAALRLEAEGISVAVVEAAVLTSEGGHDVHLPRLVAHCDPPAGIRIALWSDTGNGHETAGDRGPLGVGEVRLAGVGADRADPYRPFGCADPEAFHGSVEGAGQVGRRAGFGEQVDRGSGLSPAISRGLV